MSNEKKNEKEAMLASFSTIALNVALCAVKIIAGILGRSAALTSDGIESAGDVLRGIIVAVGIKMGSKEADKDHPYGHETFECVAALMLYFFIGFTGVALGWESVRTLFTKEGTQSPAVIALIVSAVSVAIKYVMYKTASVKAKKLSSPALEAESKDHLSDVFASSGVSLGIIGAMLGYPQADSIAGAAMSVLIVRTAIDIFRENAAKITDKSCNDEVESEMAEAILSVDGVKRLDLLNTRQFANKIYVEVEVAVDRDLNLTAAHDIAQEVHDRVEREFAPAVKHVMVHVNPT